MRLHDIARATAIASLLLFNSAHSLAGEKVQIRWNGDYPHNNERVWSQDYILGWSKNFMNGAPEENGVVRREGYLAAEVFKPKGAGPFPFVILMHGCGGMDKVATQWAETYTDFLNDAGVGTVVLDSFATRNVKSNCGPPDGHWARRRVEDAYSTLEYVASTGYADISRVYVAGRSNGGRAVVKIMEKSMARHHKHKFAAGFALVPNCATKKNDDFYAPMIAFIAGDDDANPASHCIEMGQKKRAADHPPLKVIVYDGAYHGYMDNMPFRYFNGWRMGYSHSPTQDTKRQILAHLKGEPIQSGVERK